MQIDKKILKADECAAYDLRSLYRRFGYSRYKMSKFEEYALYIRNKDFLVSDGIISFTDTNGRLLALKPDVTLSIINNSKDIEGHVQKLYYDENVYRISRSSGSYKEIKQIGLECIGDIEDSDLCETVMLAIRSLEKISDEYFFEISHVGVLEAVFEEISLDAVVEKKVLDCISRKSADELDCVCAENGISDVDKKKIRVFIQNFITLDSVKRALLPVCTGESSFSQYTELCMVLDFLSGYGLGGKVRVDFSLTNDMSYYSGVAFKGYIKDIPVSVLSGGQYDKLMQNMGRRSGAVGFAVYLDALERYNFEEKEYDVDIILLHNGNVSAALKTAEELSSDGMSVRVCARVPDGVTYRRVVSMTGEVEK